MNNPLQTTSLNQLIVLALPRYKARDVLALVADLAVRSALRVVDGGNLFNVLILNRLIRRKTGSVREILERIYIRRAFTCFQMESMLRDPADSRSPLIVLDLLHTFYDESVDDQQSRRLLADCIGHLQRQGRQAPVMVSIFPSPKAGKRPFLIQMLTQAANSVWQPESRPALPLQPALWE